MKRRNLYEMENCRPGPLPFLALSAGSAEAEWTLGPGLAPPLPTNPAFSTKGWQEGTMNVNIPVSKDETC